MRTTLFEDAAALWTGATINPVAGTVFMHCRCGWRSATETCEPFTDQVDRLVELAQAHYLTEHFVPIPDYVPGEMEGVQRGDTETFAGGR